MNKYKVLAIINILLGIIEVFISLSFLLFTLPKLMRLYSEFGNKSPSYFSIYIVFGFVLLMAFANFFTGFKLFSKSQVNKHKYLKCGIILLVITFVLSGLIMGMASLSSILPIYSLTSQF